MPLNTCVRKGRICKSSDLNFYIKNLEKEEQMKTKVSRGRKWKYWGRKQRNRKQTSGKVNKIKSCLRRIKVMINF